MRTVVVAIVGLSAGLAACRDLAGPTEVGVGTDARLAVQVNLTAALEVTQVRLHVTAPDLADTLRFALSIEDGEARGTAVVPAGPQRTFTLQALDTSQVVRYEGSTTIDMIAGPNPPLTIVMMPVDSAGEVPIVGQFGSYTVELAPAADTIAVGQSVRLAATVWDPWGNLLSGALPTWGSSAPSIATVDANGEVTARAAGRATITAGFGGAAASALIEVVDSLPPPSEPAPSSVTDLAVANIATNSVTLSFTEVSDGAGSPASYDIRFAVAPISWGSAEQVDQGTCSLPVVGSSIGTQRTCTVEGLAPSTDYQFQLVAFRGTLNVDAVFGQLSNVAAATTAAPSTPDPTASWPHEPAGMTLLTDNPWSTLENTGWLTSDPDLSQIGIVSDSTAPLSPPFVYQHFYPAGWTAGAAGGLSWYLLQANELFIGLYFKYSPDWQQPSAGLTKLFYVFQQAGLDRQSTFIAMRGPTGGPYELEISNEPEGGVWWNQNIQNVRVAAGRWHRLEIYYRKASASGVADGVVRWWVDGILAADHPAARLRGQPFSQFHLAPVWGGVGGTKSHDDWFRIDHIRISGR